MGDKHTPGPWHHHNGEQVHADYINAHGNRHHHIVATVAAHLEGKEHPAGIPFEFNAEANARLIAAAPDLLEALERIMHYAHLGASVSDVDTSEQPQFVRAKAAIAKARGEQ